MILAHRKIWHKAAMTPRPQLAEDRRTPAVADAMATFHTDIVREVREAVERDPVVVVGMAQNPVVKKVRQALTEAKIAFTYLEYGSYLGEWKKRLAIKLWSGWPTFPQVFVRGVLIGGNAETRAAIADGSLATRMEQRPS
jgi:glutaredoxin-related protein